jgi:hypothetical protein
MGGVSVLVEPQLDENFDDLHRREAEVAAQGEKPESDTAFGATKAPEIRNETCAADIKILATERDQKAAREIGAGHVPLSKAGLKKFTLKNERPAIYAPAQHEPDCLWRRDDTCTCGPVCEWEDGHVERWWVRLPSASWSFAWDTWKSWYIQGPLWVKTDDEIPPPKAVHGTADRRSRALDVSTEAEQRAQIAYRKKELVIKLGAIDAALTAMFDSAKQCAYCGSSFIPERSTKRFCCDAHKQRHHHNGAMERPIFRCEEFDPPLRWVTPTLVDLGSPHDEVCQNRSKSLLRDICTCGMRRTGRVGEFVTVRKISDAKITTFEAKPEDVKQMAA